MVVVIERQSKIKLRHIEAFVAIADASSFREASEQLLVSQSALTVTIRQLEEIVGIRLFDRTTRRVSVTEAGAAFLPGARRLLQDLRSVLGELETFVSLDRGCVRMAALPSIAAEWLPSAVSRFSRNYPKIDFEFHSDDSQGIYRQLLDREIDFGLAGQVLPHPEISHQKVVSQPVALVTWPKHPFAQRAQPVRWTELKGATFIHAGNSDSIRAVVEEHPELQETFSNTRYKTNKANIVAALVREQLGVTAVTPVVIPKEIRDDLAVLPLIEPEIIRNVYVVKRYDTSLLPVTHEFMGFIVEQMQQARRASVTS
ncbi:LysR family transcriptional regulator [Mesorhizobium sp. Z1-4]|uniref:LysR family transcriptional regulator n=1 Tax=Mesorhizobium sp. Z1-4 TaxID=2448478 RepID=UPI0013DE9D5C|nr:LysR family transcriptional regulator [Mesorhizobium sp. Z1-4]